MDRELQEDRKNDVRIENVIERTLLGQFLDWTCSRYAQKALPYTKISDKLGVERDVRTHHRHEHASDGDLIVTKLDAIEILHAQTVRRYQAVECQDLIHLRGRNQRASTLPDDVRDWNSCSAGNIGPSNG